MSKLIAFYDRQAERLAEQYQSLSFEQVHKDWQPYWPVVGNTTYRVLDVGAGSGRDALWFAKQGCDVYALEPANALREHGKRLTAEYTQQVTWLDDTLPGLERISSLGLRFDCILLSAVWMHLTGEQRKRAFRKLTNLLAPSGILVISLRHGPFEDERNAYPVSVSELEDLAKERALKVCHVSGNEIDALGRSEVHWQTVVMQLPDDGSGDLIKVRQIIVNDAKSATYKLALLRTLLRIADAHPIAMTHRLDGKVQLPLGLVALYWIRQFKRLIDIDIEGEGIQQSGDSSKGLGFVKELGWNQLKHLTADDLSIGATFMGAEAKALQATIRDTLSTLKSGPVKYTYQGSIDNPLFHLERNSVITKDEFQLDIETLSSFGSFVLDESLWHCLRLYNSWIEPLVINQWISEMRRYKRNEERGIALQTYYDQLKWVDEQHDTRRIRDKVTSLQLSGEKLVSVWSGKILKPSYQIDHCLPFAYWPNNDRWNLLPTSREENNQKRARVPSKVLLHHSRNRIIDWWQMAWQTDQERQVFFNQAVLSLPQLPAECSNFDDVFEAMGLQIDGVKSRLLVGEWGCR